MMSCARAGGAAGTQQCRPNIGAGAMMSKRAFLVALAASTCGFSAAPVSAQDYPVRPITIVVPFPAGGPTDAAARIVSERMRSALGGSVVIENVAGAGGSLGIGRVAH